MDTTGAQCQFTLPNASGHHQASSQAASASATNFYQEQGPCEALPCWSWGWCCAQTTRPQFQTSHMCAHHQPVQGLHRGPAHQTTLETHMCNHRWQDSVCRCRGYCNTVTVLQHCNRPTRQRAITCQRHELNATQSAKSRSQKG